MLVVEEQECVDQMQVHIEDVRACPQSQKVLSLEGGKTQLIGIQLKGT